MKHKVVIDPGHGGQDPGAIGYSNTHEADINLALAMELKKELEAAGWEVKLTRQSPKENPSLTTRGKIAVNFGADLFISEHCNSVSNQNVAGVEVYYSVDQPENRDFAGRLSAAIAEVLNTRDRGAKIKESTKYPGEDYYTVVDTAQDGGVPVVLLVENGFLSNPEEEAKLKDPHIQQRIAKAQAGVISLFFNKKEKALTPIMGKPEATLQQARSWLKQKAPDWVLMADLYYSIASQYGVRADVALAQACKETGFFRFGGLVKPEQNNFAGLGATGPGNPGHTFPDRATGVEAHIQHLFAYATDKPLPEGVKKVDPRFDLVRRGSAPYVEWLGAAENPTGVGWAYPGVDYGKSIVRDYLAQLLAVQVPEREDGQLQILRTENEQLRKQYETAVAENNRLRSRLRQIYNITKRELEQ